jgi:flagella basal body P-ring formation protein FlgA
VIQRGDPVVLVSRSGGIEVRASGRALAAAGVDERISVENVSSRRVVQGQVLASGEVLVR